MLLEDHVNVEVKGSFTLRFSCWLPYLLPFDEASPNTHLFWMKEFKRRFWRERKGDKLPLRGPSMEHFAFL